MGLEFLDKIGEKLGILEVEQEVVEREQVVKLPKREELKRTAVYLKKQGDEISIVVVEPRVFDDVRGIAERMREGKVVVVDFEGTEDGVMVRIVDFMSGASCALDGGMRKVGGRVFVCVPVGGELIVDRL